MQVEEPEYGRMCVHIDLNTPEGLQWGLDTGIIWNGGPRTVAMAVGALLDGTATRPKYLPDEVRAYLRLQDRIRQTD